MEATNSGKHSSLQSVLNIFSEKFKKTIFQNLYINNFLKTI